MNKDCKDYNKCLEISESHKKLIQEGWTLDISPYCNCMIDIISGTEAAYIKK